MISLEKQIYIWMKTVVTIILIILGIWSIESITDYQKNQNETYYNRLEQNADNINESIESLSNVLSSVYSSSEDFQMIGQNLPVSERWNYIYNMKNACDIQVESNKKLAGFFVYYFVQNGPIQNDGWNTIYNVQNNISFDSCELIKNVGFEMMKEEENFNVNIINVQDSIFYVENMKKNNAAVLGAVDFSNEIESKEKNSMIGIIADQNCFFLDEKERPEISEDILLNLKEGKNTISGYCIYMKELDIKGICLIEVIPKSIWLYLVVAPIK